MRYLLILFIFFLTAPCHAATYYLANEGNDNNDGLAPETAWQTIDKLNSVQIPDNSTILFKRGDTFRGSIQLLKSPKGITFSAFGEEVFKFTYCCLDSNPVISGSVGVTGWKLLKNPKLSDKIYVADTSKLPLTADGIQQLFFHGTLAIIARYPNVTDWIGRAIWLKVGKGEGKNAFSDPQLAAYQKPDGYWKGATLRIRNYSWTYMVLEIADSTAAGKIITKPEQNFELGEQLPEWGYFIDGKLEELDSLKEWFYDAAGQQLYFYPDRELAVDSTEVEAATYDIGLKISNQENNTVVENLTFRNFTKQGIQINGSDNVTVRNCLFDNNETGLYAWNSANLLISNNKFYDHRQNAITLQAAKDFDVKNSVIANNSIWYTAMVPGYGERYRGVYQGIGIVAFGRGFTLRDNRVANTGHAGIVLKDQGHHLVERNAVSGSLQLLNDGGAIVISSDGNVIRGNFLSHSLGNTDESNGCGSTTQTPCMHHSRYGMGIGADNNFKNNVIEENVIYNNTDMGIRLNAFTDTIVRNNVLYNNDPQIAIEDKKGESRNNVVENNLMFSVLPDQLGLVLTGSKEHGTFDHNHYCNQASEVVIERDNRQYSLAFFQHTFPTLEQHASNCLAQFPKVHLFGVDVDPQSVDLLDIFRANFYANSLQSGNNLITNATFEQNVTGWRGDVEFDGNKIGLNGGSLKSTGTGKTAFAHHSGLLLQQGQTYHLQFSVIGNGFGNLQVRINDTTENNRAILQERMFAYDTSRKDYDFVFTAPRTTSEGQVLFITREYDATYWLDNISLYPTAPIQKQDAGVFRLFPNHRNETYDWTCAFPINNFIYQNLDGSLLPPMLQTKETVDWMETVVGCNGQTLSIPPYSWKLVTAISPPPPPRLFLHATPLASGQYEVNAQWSEVLGAQGYRLFYAPYPGAETVYQEELGKLTQLSVKLPAGAKFYVAIKAYGERGESDYSNIQYIALD